MRREFGLELLLGAAGAGLVVFALRQTWAHAIFTPPRPLPVQDIPVTGQQLVPLAGALALAGLACLAAVIATRSTVRRVVGTVLAALGAAAAVAAGAAVGAAGVAADRTFLAPDSGSPRRAAELDPVDGQWLGVASEAELAAGTPHRFATASLVGFVTATGDGLVAVSGACTHLGCILQQNDTAGRFDCPCHRTAFGHDGRLLLSQLPEAPAPLTRLQVRRREGSVEVLLPPPV